MARQGRIKSSTGIYHAMLRGIDKREIFLDDEDRAKFLFYLSRAKEKSNYDLYGYCLMNNHVHLLMKEGSEEIGTTIKRIAVSYVQWHNLKYSRTGHLFQNRYKSEPVEDEGYLLTVLRYIHQNPIKAGLVQDISHYRWSSYQNYVNKSDLDLVNPIFIKQFFKNQVEFIEFMKMLNNDQPMEYEVKLKYSDEDLKHLIVNTYAEPEMINSLPKKERDKIIKDIKQFTGASNRQLSRVLGIGRGIIERV
jgi:putative transposase